MKSVWNGSISFGLVNIPVKLYSVAQPTLLGFRLLCSKCKTPLRYKRFCPHCKKEVAWGDVVKGLEIKKDHFYVLTKEKLDKLKPEKTNNIEILSFIDKAQIDSIYLDKNYYVVPATEKEKAYFLFQEVLSLAGKVAIGRFVMREKERICAISAYKNGLLLTTLNYAYEIRDISKIEELRERPKLSQQEKSLAQKLINQMLVKEFSISDYKDTFAEELKKLIQKEMKGEKIEIKAERPKKAKTLLAALKASVRS